ncbi:MAG: hypothetical protein JNL30_09335 [Rubrivivax sp.]|nr:hypothetical protein [Rubrivivax sp.]
MALLSGGGAAAAEVTLTHGPFEIVAEGRRISSGTFPNTSGNPFASIEVISFSVRWRGREVEVPVVGRRFWRVLRLADAPRPALLVSTTDFHLLTEEDGQLRVQSLGPKSTNIARVQWLDSEQGQPGPVLMFGIERVLPDDGTLLRGGRWLRLPYNRMLDVKTLTLHETRPRAPQREGVALPALRADDSPALMLAPDQGSYVTGVAIYDRARHLATGKVHYRHALVVLHITGAEEAYALPLDRSVTRYIDGSDFSVPWLQHHFEWKRDAAGRDRLEARANFERWPWTVRYSEGPSGYAQVLVPRARPPMAEVLRRLLHERLQASVIDDLLEPGKRSGNTLAIPSCRGIFQLFTRDEEVSVYIDRPKDPPVDRCRAPLKQLAALIDEELASGRHDALFIGD